MSADGSLIVTMTRDYVSAKIRISMPILVHTNTR